MVEAIEAGKEYKVIDRSSLHYGKVVVISEVQHGIGVAQLGNGPYPFLPRHLEPLVPAAPKPKRATPAKRAAILKDLVERVLATQPKLPEQLTAELEAALKL